MTAWRSPPPGTPTPDSAAAQTIYGLWCATGAVMSAAALTLAVALLIMPSPSRHRLEALRPVARVRRRLPVVPCAAAMAWR